MLKTAVTALTTLSAAALVGGTAVAGPATTPASSASAPARVAAAAPVWQTHYLVASHQGRTARLSVVDRRTGAVQRTIATAPMLADGLTPFGDATFARDGSVYAVTRGAGTYSSKLIRIAGGRTTLVMPYAVAARVSPDGTRLAVTVMSPDVDRDRKGTGSVRVGSVTGRGGFRTLASSTFPVDRAGEPATEVALPMVHTWSGNHHLVVSRGCCDYNAVSVISADRPARMATWPKVEGTAQTYPVARYADGSVLVPRNVDVGRGTEADPVRTVRYDLLRVSPARPRGVKVGAVASDAKVDANLGAFIRRTSGEALVPWVTSLRYRGPGVADDSFVAR